jgi:prepilin peptidase CpaA
LIVAWRDLRIKKISNAWALINFLLVAPSLYIFNSDVYPWSWSVLIYPVSWIIGGFILFNLRIMGAGDSKYLASLFAITPPGMHEKMLLILIYSTLMVGFVLLGKKIAQDFRKIRAYAITAYWKGLRDSIRSQFSYAPVILLAWLILGLKIWK